MEKHALAPLRALERDAGYELWFSFILYLSRREGYERRCEWILKTRHYGRAITNLCNGGGGWT